jgi:hypothetical protein
MKLGAEPKKTAFLAVVLLVAAIGYFGGGDDRPKSNGKGSAPAATPVSGSAGPRAAVTPTAAKSGGARPNSNRRTSQEFKPVLRPRRVEDRIDPTTIDPTLRTDLLARLGKVPIQGGSRPLFEFGAAPPPKAPDPGKIIPTKPVTVAAAPPAPSKPAVAGKPQAPPIPLKFYGFTSARAGAKRAFFLENEDVFVANEGDVVKKRYKVVRINMNSVLMEDTEFKQQQTLALTEQIQ